MQTTFRMTWTQWKSINSEEGRKVDKSIWENRPRYEPFKNTHRLGRNESCYCGSNKKFKKCCLPSL